MANTVLVVEDEPKLAQLMCDYLSQAGFASHHIARGDEVTAWVKDNNPQLVLLDLMLPGIDGLDVCKALREFSNIPVIMVTARVEEVDRLLGLEVGADDYICKPFSPREVVARVKAMLRRVLLDQQPQADSSELLILDSGANRVTIGDKSVDLTVVEFQMLTVLHDRPGRIFSRDQLMTTFITTIVSCLSALSTVTSKSCVES